MLTKMKLKLHDDTPFRQFGNEAIENLSIYRGQSAGEPIGQYWSASKADAVILSRNGIKAARPEPMLIEAEFTGSLNTLEPAAVMSAIELERACKVFKCDGIKFIDNNTGEFLSRQFLAIFIADPRKLHIIKRTSTAGINLTAGEHGRRIGKRTIRSEMMPLPLP